MCEVSYLNQTMSASSGLVAKRKIVIKKKESTAGAEAPSLSFRLLDFNIYDVKDEVTVDQQQQGQQQQPYETGTGSSYYNKKMVIQIFGINETGQTCALFVEDMQPFFYVLVPDNWNEYTKKNFVNHVVKQLRFRWNGD